MIYGWRWLGIGAVFGSGLVGAFTAMQQPALEGRVAALETRVAGLESRAPLASPAVSESYSITGSFLLRQALPGEPMRDIAPCVGINGYGDITVGLEVVVRDGSGNVLAVGELGPGEWIEEPRASEVAALDFNCLFPLRVDGVPRVPFYGVSVGRRGELTFTFDEMVANGWEVQFSIGENEN